MENFQISNEVSELVFKLLNPNFLLFLSKELPKFLQIPEKLQKKKSIISNQKTHIKKIWQQPIHTKQEQKEAI